MSALRLSENAPVAPWVALLYRLQEDFVRAGLLPHPSLQQPSWLVALQMSCMPKKFSNLMQLIRQREHQSMPTLEEFIQLLTAEEEAINTQAALANIRSLPPPRPAPPAPIVEQTAAVNLQESHKNPRPNKRKRSQARTGNNRARGRGSRGDATSASQQ